MGESRIKGRSSQEEAGNAAGMTPECITITTTDGNAKAAKFSTYDVYSIRDVMIQNLSAFDCYIIFDTDAIVADATKILLRASSSINLVNVQYTHFSVIRIGNDNVSVRITGIGN